MLNQTLTLKIERLANGGDGVARHEGKTIFVPYSAPGDTVQVVVEVDKPRFARGRIESIVEPSPERVEPRCAVFGKCGGCQWQHLDYAAQLRHKEQIFRETLERIGDFKDLTIEPIVGADQAWEYRRRIQLKANKAGQIGFYAHASHDVVPIERCDISDPHLNEALASGKVPPRELELAWTGEKITMRFGDHRSFEQVHPMQNLELVKLVKDYVAPESHHRLFELYCGNGNFTEAIAPHCKHIFAVDQNAEAVGKATRTFQEQGVKGAHLVVGAAEWGLKKMIRDKEAIDTLLLDPPRAGAKDILDLIAELSPHRVVYVSCDPASLSRDLKYLTQRGYRLVRSRPIDMIPQTFHIESVNELIHA